MNVMTTLAPGGTVGGGLGRASQVALATVTDGRIDAWEEVPVGWDRLHDEGTEGSHHARIATFLKEHDVEVVVTGHAGPGMQRMLGTMGLRLVMGGRGDAREAAVEAAAS
jgi:predicted Fe-Mo cluster-binding NifX family protein